MEEEDKSCVVCLDNDVEIELVEPKKCSHKCLCIGCYLKLSKMMTTETITCPLCRTETRFAYGSAKKLCSVLYSDRLNDDFFKFLKNYVKILTPFSNMEKISETIRGGYKDMFLKNEKYPLLTVDQVEIILKMAFDVKLDVNNSFHKFQHLLVCLCIHPWTVSIPLASSGVCYHGNMGDMPTLKRGKDLIMENQKSIFDGGIVKCHE